MKYYLNFFCTIVICAAILMPITSHAEREKAEEKEIPNFLSSVLDISDENTYSNTLMNEEQPNPNELTKSLLNDADIQIHNPKLIKMLNETDLRPSPIAIGYRGMIYMGKWPIKYETKEHTTNWNYQKINTNQKDNQDGYETEKMHYVQEKEKTIQGALTTKVEASDQVKSMVLAEAQKQSDMPLSFHTVVGKGTDMNLHYGVPRKEVGILETYAPAVYEKGKVTFGEVYLKLKGSNKELVVQNITEKEVGAWIPVQDHISITYKAQ